MLSFFKSLFIKSKKDFSAEELHEKAIYFFEKKRFKDAIEYESQAITKNSKKAEYYLIRGNAFSAINNKDKCLDDYKKAIVLNPNFALAYFNIGCHFSEENNDKEALHYYKKSFEIDPDYIGIKFNYAFSFFKLKEYQKAIIFFNLHLKEYSKDGFAHYYLSQCYNELHNYKLSEKHRKKAIELKCTLV